MVNVCEESYLFVLKCQINNISSEYSGLLTSYENLQGIILIEDSIFSNIFAEYTIFDCSDTNLTIINCSFSSIVNFNIQADSCLVYISKIYVQNMTCQNLVSGCVLTFYSQSYLEITDSKLENISNFNLLGNLYFEQSIANISNLLINDAYAGQNTGACLYSENSNISITNSMFQSYYYNCLNMIETVINLTNMTFDNTNVINLNLKGIIENGAISCESCESFIMQNSLIRKNTNSITGSGLMLINPNFQTSVNNFLVSNCTFESNEATDSGGAIYISSVIGKIISTLFYSNTANYGGGIYYFTSGIL